MTTQIKTVVLVNGVPASGKTTVTRQLSERFSLPVLTIDGIKEPFMAQFSEIDRAFNRKLGCAAYDVIWSIIRHAPAGCPFLVDAWFGFQPKEKLVDYLEKAGVTRILEVWNAVTLTWPSRGMLSALASVGLVILARSICRSWRCWPPTPNQWRSARCFALNREVKRATPVCLAGWMRICCSKKG
jgi:hypothetical protein